MFQDRLALFLEGQALRQDARQAREGRRRRRAGLVGRGEFLDEERGAKVDFAIRQAYDRSALAGNDPPFQERGLVSGNAFERDQRIRKVSVTSSSVTRTPPVEFVRYVLEGADEFTPISS